MQQLYLFTYHWMYIFSACHILATFGLHDASVVLVYLSLDLYIFYLSYICNIWTARWSSYTCLLTIGCIYFLLVIYSQHSDCTMQQLYLFTYHWMYMFSTCHIFATFRLHDQHLYLFTYHWINIFSTRHILATFGLHDAAVVLVYLPLDLYFLLVIYLQHLNCMMQQLYLFTYHSMYISSTRH